MLLSPSFRAVRHLDAASEPGPTGAPSRAGLLHSILQRAVHSQVWLSERFDRLIPARFRVDGNADFIKTFVCRHLRPGSLVFDVGGGKQPLLSAAQKQDLGVAVIGLDIDANELCHAPAGAYDATICADIAHFQGNQSAQVVICQALLEHVPDVSAAIRSISTMLADGGVALLFVPARTAWFARLNRILPPAWKQRLLFTIFPETERQQGFDAFYDRCTPGELVEIAKGFDLHAEELRLYYTSSYFSCIFPLYVLWRLCVLVFAAIAPRCAAETFSLALRKPPSGRKGCAAS